MGNDADVYGLKLDGQLGVGVGVDGILGRGFAHEVRSSYEVYRSAHSILIKRTLCISHIPSILSVCTPGRRQEVC